MYYNGVDNYFQLPNQVKLLNNTHKVILCGIKGVFMNDNRKLDLRIIKTRSAIKQALRDMVVEMDINEITIKELSLRANINRKTFYLHYTCIEALFEDLLLDIANDYFSQIDVLPIPMSMEEVNRVFFTHLAGQDKFTEKIITAPSYSTFCNKLFSMNLKHNRERHNPYAHFSLEQQNIINTFLVTSSLEMYKQWIKDNKSIPLEDIIQLSGTLLSYGVESIKQGEQ